MLNKTLKTIICLGGLFLATSCTSYRTVYVTEAQLKAVKDSEVVLTPAPDVIVLDDGSEYFLYERRVRRYRPYYSHMGFSRGFSRGYFGPHYYTPGYYARPRGHFEFGMGFSRRF